MIRPRCFGLALLLLFASDLRAQEPAPPTDENWRTLGLMRVRDMTPFGISRLDMLPAHSVEVPRRTWAIEANMSYQNTWARSRNVRRYLSERGIQRGQIGEREIAEIVALPGEAYLVDAEIGLIDLTLHYRASERFSFYATIPYFIFSNGFLDATIEGFHNTIGIENAGRNYAQRNRFVAVVDLREHSLILDAPPRDEFGDPVFGVRYNFGLRNQGTTLVVEAAAKLVLQNSQRLVSTGRNDFGVQVSLQQFFDRNALYLTLAEVYFASPERGFADSLWLPTIIGGWETKLTRHVNLITQLYLSKSNIQKTALDELSAPKIQATAGLQWIYRKNALRFGITENIANYDNTPDIGVNLSFGRILGK